jgi:hypothetical protein
MRQTTNEKDTVATQQEAQLTTEATAATPQDAPNTETKTLEQIEEIDSSTPGSQPGKPESKKNAGKEQPPVNPLIQDPYDWDLCTITLVYALLADQTVSVSIHNHKDEPIIKTFPATEVVLPEKISGVLDKLQSIWPDSTVSATVALMPKKANATERNIIVSMRAGQDTPIIQTGVESDLCLPSQIQTMLHELKDLLPARALKRIEKDAKTRISPTKSKTASKSAMKTAATAPAAPNKSQLSLF